MARGTKHPGCWACHRFMPPAEGFLDWDSLAVTGADGTWPGRPGGGLVGDGPAVTVLKVYYHSNTSHLAALCGFRSDVIFRDFSLLAVSANGTALGRGHKSAAGWWGGVGFRSGSAVALEMSSLSISGFIYGVRTRYMVMGAFSMLEISDCACGIDLARSADAFGEPPWAPSLVCFSTASQPLACAGSDDETSSSGWNAWDGGKEGGWYNNVVSFRNVHVQGGEIGIRATDMCATYISCCCEDQRVKATDTDKVLLQPHDVGVGLWLESGNCNRSEAGGNNVIIDFYSEETTNPLRFLDKTSVLDYDKDFSWSLSPFLLVKLKDIAR